MKFRVRVAREFDAVTHWQAPFTGGFTCIPPVGTVLVAAGEPPEGAPGFYCRPENYAEFEQRFVPVADRSALKYDGYSVVASLSDIGSTLEFIGDS